MIIKLTDHFSLDEMIRSDYAVRMGLDNTPPPDYIANLKHLCHDILEYERSLFYSPIFVTSGYRSLMVNQGIGGSLTSQHMTGCAADHKVVGTSDEAVVRRIVGSPIIYDQLILEFPDGANGWVHISWSLKPRRQTLIATRAVNGHTVYEPWQG